MVNSNENEMEITVLGEIFKKSKPQISEILPEWISNCVKIDSSLKNSKKFDDIQCLSKKLINNLEKLNIHSFFPVQHAVIPAIIDSWTTINLLRPHDICVCAPTGSGKTLSYAVPLLQLLSESRHGSKIGPRAIVVLPVRDLAIQVHKAFESISNDLGLKCALIAGMKNLTKERADLLPRSDESTDGIADIIICTPGRLVEHIKNTEGLVLSSIQHLIIDEADRVLEDPKHDWFLTLSRHIDLEKRRKTIASSFRGSCGQVIQKILLSATLTKEPHLLEHFDLHQPRLFMIGALETPHQGGTLACNKPEGLKELLVVYHKEYTRILFIVDQIRRQGLSRLLCFTNTKDSATRLHALLREFQGVRCAHLHCEQPPDVRQRLRARMEKGELDVLVTVDSMARGMDIAGLAGVIQYEVSPDVSVYIHRVGRTARAGAEGLAFALVKPNQVFHLKSGLARYNRKVSTSKFAEGKCFRYMNEYNAALEKLRRAHDTPAVDPE